MDVIKRNFFRLLLSGALNQKENIEPMSYFKWRRLSQMAYAQHVENYVKKGVETIANETWINVPDGFLEETDEEAAKNEKLKLNNRLLNHRLHKIEQAELHAIDTNVGALDVLKIIVSTVSTMLNQGIMLKGVLRLGTYLRTKGDKVDFVKLAGWLDKLHIRRMAQLQGSMLITVFGFEKEELQLIVDRVEPAAFNLVVRSINHTAEDTAEEWHFRQNRSGFVTNNSALLRRNLRRSLRYITYAPLETISNYFSNFTLSLQEIEE